MNTIGRMILTGKAEVTGENPVPLPLCPTQIPHGVLQDQRSKTNRLRLRVKVTAIPGELTRRERSWEQRSDEESLRNFRWHLRVNFLQFWEQVQGGGRISCYERAEMNCGRSGPLTHWLDKARFRKVKLAADELWISFLMTVKNVNKMLV